MRFYDIFKCQDIRQNIFKQKKNIHDNELLEIYFILKLAFRFKIFLKIFDEILNSYKNGFTLYRLHEIDLLINYKGAYEELRGLIDFEYMLIDDMMVSHYHIPIKFRKKVIIKSLNKRMKRIPKSLVDVVENKYDAIFMENTDDMYKLSIHIKYCFTYNLKCHFKFDGVLYKLFNKDGRRICRRNTYMLNNKIVKRYHEWINVNEFNIPLKLDLAFIKLKKYL